MSIIEKVLTESVTNDRIHIVQNNQDIKYTGQDTK